MGFDAAGGADAIVVHALAGTGVATVELDLQAFGAGDAQADTVAVRGTDGADQVNVGASAGNVVVSGLGARVQVAGSEPSLDEVNVASLGDADTISMGSASRARRRSTSTAATAPTPPASTARRPTT